MVFVRNTDERYRLISETPFKARFSDKKSRVLDGLNLSSPDAINKSDNKPWADVAIFIPQLLSWVECRLYDSVVLCVRNYQITCEPIQFKCHDIANGSL